MTEGARSEYHGRLKAIIGQQFFGTATIEARPNHAFTIVLRVPFYEPDGLKAVEERLSEFFEVEVRDDGRK